MKKIIIGQLLAIAACLPLLAAGKNTDLANTTWKETSRMSPAGRLLDYTDTMRITFLIGNEYTRSRTNGFIYRGTYKLSEKALDMGAFIYTLLGMEQDKMVLKDDGGTYVFTRYTAPPAQSINDHTASTRRADEPVAPRAVRQLSDLTGNWEVFKRTSSTQQTSIDYERILRRVRILSHAKGDTLGYVYSAKEYNGQPSWYIRRYDNSTIICGGRDERRLQLLSYSSGELILQEGDITYFFKEFK